MDEYEEHTEENTGIARAQSAYLFYTKDQTSKVREELLKDGKDASMGATVTIISKRWKELPADQKGYYENLAKADKARYLKECEIRDEEVLRQQEERRLANNATATETKMRGSTLAVTDASQVKVMESSNRKRERSQEEIDEMNERRAVKKAQVDSITAQHDELKQKRVEQAEARLKYLLSQSDIFTHFGVGGKKPEDPAKLAAKESTAAGGSRHRQAAATGKGKADLDELDDDEKDIVREEEEEDDGAAKPHGVFLTKQPSSITGGTMRQYQLEGLNWVARLIDNGINGILADEMGLGKTLQSISVLAYMKEYLNITGPHLVMVPKSTLSNWMNEFRNWCPSIRTLKFHGNKEERQAIIDDMMRPSATQDQREWDVLITTYEIVNMERNALTKIAWRYLIIDEAHRLKNEASQFSMTVRTLNTQYRLLLTGTPLQNNLHELWALLNFLLPDVFASAEQFDEWFNLDVDDTEAKQRMIGQLHKILRPFMIRRLKSEVEKSLPPKKETILFTGMSTVQKTLYTQILLRDIDTINSGGGPGNGSRTQILNIVMQLRKCCNHPYLFPGVEDRTQDPLGDHLYASCGKMALLDKLLAKMKQRDHRVLIFSQMTRMLDILEDYLISKGYLYCRIDGNTSYEEREDRIADYNRPGSDKFIFLLSTRAGGLGINLQTADTVIIYDSDWNPQADLQAQDRAHRIGQKKKVQVFRLVTDDTVEVKVVERAQQKLKLDAMVVQQGRLADKEKKLSKQDLLDTIKFGADKIFRSKESTITDDDIDLILQEGEKRTEEMTEKLQSAEKGDLYNFSLDSGLSTQMFEGKDYSDKAFREAELLNFIDIGKRERKVIANYSESAPRVAEDNTEKRPKIPRHLKLPKMDDWQFYDREQLNMLHNEELRIFEEIVDRGEAPQSGAISRFQVLDAEKQAEKNRLLDEAFGSWTRVHYNNFVKSSAKHGRQAYEKIAKDVGRPSDEVKRYVETFWRKGSSVFQPTDWDRVVKQVEKGEKKLEEIQRLTSATKKLIMMFSDPWEQLTFRHVGNQGRIYNAMEDRYLLCLTHIHGYGNWDLVRSSIRRCDRFRFDFYIQSCTAEALGKRCELLMRAAEREVNEIEKKKQAVEALAVSNPRPKDFSDANKAKLETLLQEIKAESLKLAQARLHLQSLKITHKAPKTDGKGSVGDVSGSGKGSNSGVKKGPVKGGSQAASVAEESKPQPKLGGPRANPIPNSLLPELCRLVKEAGPDGIAKVIEKFVINHPFAPKRQVEIKINEIAVKEKRTNDSKLIWYILPQYEHYLAMSPEDVPAGDDADVKEDSAKKVKSSSSSSSNAATGDDAKKRKRESTDAEPNKAKKSPIKGDGEDDDGVRTAGEPKKFRRAFGWFVKEKRAEAEKVRSGVEELKDLLSQMWEELAPEDRLQYQNKEADDKARYDREMAAWRSKA